MASSRPNGYRREQGSIRGRGMAWLKIRDGLDSEPAVYGLAEKLCVDTEFLVYQLYRLASWFSARGKYGLMEERYAGLIDRYCRIDGLADALLANGWLYKNAGVLGLKWFTDVSSIRKSLSKKIRREVLSCGRCKKCGATEQLTVDHIIPISKGGTSELRNLQALCLSCNLKKGAKTGGAA